MAEPDAAHLGVLAHHPAVAVTEKLPQILRTPRPAILAAVIQEPPGEGVAEGVAPTQADCAGADFDRDGDVDQSDFGFLQRWFEGAGK